MSMIKHTTSANRLIQAIKNNIVTVTSAEKHNKNESYVESITPEDFTNDLEFYVESGIFADSIDFKYTKTNQNSLLIQIGAMSPYCNCAIKANLHVKDGVSMDAVENVLIEDTFIQKTA